MNTSLKKSNTISAKESLFVLGTKKSNYGSIGLSKAELAYLKGKLNSDSKDVVSINQYGRSVFIANCGDLTADFAGREQARKIGHKATKLVNGLKIDKVTLVDLTENNKLAMDVAEAMVLSNYQFLKYFKDAKDRANALKGIKIYSKGLAQKDIDQTIAIVEGTCEARTLVNEPWSFLTAVQLSKEIKRMGKASGFKVEVFNKAKIESLKMGGLLAVNQGSFDPPTFSIMEWKPKNAKNKKPYVFVGKGVVYDTGGLSLKPTPNSMDLMKSDMGGAASMAGAIYAIAKAKLPIHVIALIPATDNRPGSRAYTPGDVVKMHSGLTVEVLNTDAEGRMLLADALSYAKKYKPELVIDAATLTGAAVRAVGPHGIVAMGNVEDKTFDALKESGNNVFERIVEFPFWDEYGEMIKSSIADIKNIGGATAGAITAGKFLEHFVDYPWIHLDIAGPAFLDKEDAYRAKGGSGVGVRLLFDFIKNRS
jgi:leucyl aminopeptidase